MNPINFIQTPAESIISLLTTVLKTKLLSSLLMSKIPLPINLWNVIHLLITGMMTLLTYSHISMNVSCHHLSKQPFIFTG